MRELTARAMADLAWAHQDAFLRGAGHVLHREDEFVLTAPVPRAARSLTARTAVESAEPAEPGEPAELTELAPLVTVLTVTTELVDRSGTVVAVSRSTALLAAAPWRAALAV